MNKPLPDQDQGIEYSVYTFANTNNKQSTSNWEKHATKTEMNDAISLAESLFGSGKYKKIEVKQKYFDKKKNRNIDVTLKTFEGRKKQGVGTLAILVFAALCGLSAFAVTYFINQ